MAAMATAGRRAARSSVKATARRSSTAVMASVAAAVAVPGRRRSPRLQSTRELSTSQSLVQEEVVTVKRKTATKRIARTVVTTTSDKKAETATNDPNALEFRHGTLSRQYEAGKLANGKHACVVGCDEAGRGPLAGPVVAAACHVPLDVTIEGIHDSKKLTEPQREALYEQLTTHPRISFAVSINSAQRIDEINILQASLEAMVQAVEALPVPADFVFVDGNRMPPTIRVPAETVVKGDSKVYSIAAASVIAKVTRDRLMLQYHEQYPQYNLKQHKGYPTREHMAAIAKHGPCAIHRMTFAPLKPKDAPKPKAKSKTKR